MAKERNNPTYEEATASAEAEQWKQAMDEEMRKLHQFGTYRLEKLPKGRKAIGNKWVLTKKYNNQGDVTRYKARIVAQGFSQKPGQDFQWNQLYAPVVMAGSFRLLLAMAVQNDWDIHIFDADSAYLNATLPEDQVIYMKQIKGYEDGTDRVLRLIKSLYGLKQAGHEWNKVLDRNFTSIGFERCESDTCVYIRKAKPGQKWAIIASHVDDSMMFTKKGEAEGIKKEIAQIMKIKDLGEAKRFLNIQIDRNRKEGWLKLSQPLYIKEILEEYKMENCNPVKTPMALGTQLTRIEGQQNPNYAEWIGKVSWLAHMTRPDITYAVHQMAKFTAYNGEPHAQAFKHLLRYLQGTKELGITYRRQQTTDNPNMYALLEYKGKESSGQIINHYTDADHASDKEDRRSISGYIATYAQGPFTWNSTKQSVVATSTMESEYIAIHTAVRNMRSYQQLLSELDLDKGKEYKLHIDNRAASTLLQQPQVTNKSKSVDISYHYSRRCLKRNLFTPLDIPTERNLADLLTKPLPPQRLQQLLHSIMC